MMNTRAIHFCKVAQDIMSDQIVFMSGVIRFNKGVQMHYLVFGW